MKDTELRARLLQLGMPREEADRTAALLRDRIHPIAALAANKAIDHLEGLALCSAVGVGALDEYGYYYDGTAGIFKKIGKGLKKVAKGAVKVVKKVALPVAAIVAAPVTGGASIAAYGAIKSAKIGSKASKRATAASIAQTNASITGQPVAVSDVSALSADIKRKKRVKVPKDVAKASDALAKQVAQSGIVGNENDITSQLMNALLSQQTGSAMSSPAAQGIMQDVAAQGVEATPAGPAPMPSWLVPVGVGVGALVLVLMLKRGK